MAFVIRGILVTDVSYDGHELKCRSGNGTELICRVNRREFFDTIACIFVAATVTRSGEFFPDTKFVGNIQGDMAVLPQEDEGNNELFELEEVNQSFMKLREVTGKGLNILRDLDGSWGPYIFQGFDGEFPLSLTLVPHR